MIEKDTCIPMFTAELFTIARTWEMYTHTHTHTHIYRMEYYSVIRRNAFESVLMRWMNLEPIIQSEVNQKE